MLTEINSFLSFYSKSSFEGYSVYDAFNSPFLNVISRSNIHLLNVVVTQVFKRTPINIRPLFGVKKSINPKSLGLALKGALIGGDEVLVDECISMLLDTRVDYKGHSCWGYNWDYYTLRGGTFPKNFPNAITTYFIADALLDYVKGSFCKDKTETLNLLSSIRMFFLEDLNRSEFDEGFCFSYSPADKKVIYNASALVTKFLIRSRDVLGSNPALDELIEKSVAFIFSRLELNGTWFYGEAENQKWVDSFHSEYMLEFCLEVSQIDQDAKYLSKIKQASDCYLSGFLQEGGLCPYYYNSGSVYPVNVHSVASMIIYLCKLDMVEKASMVIQWAFKNLYDAKHNGFYFELGKYVKNRNIYHRWNNSWMYLACQCYLEKIK